MLGAVSDLHAADARYYAECKLNFMSPKHVRLAAAGSTLSSEQAKVDSAFEHVADVMLKDEIHIWNSIELFQMYTAEGGRELTRRQLIQSLTAKFGDKLLVLSASGVASIIVFKHRAPVLLKLVNDNDDSDIDTAITTVSKKIVNETKRIEIDRNQYETRLQT